MRDIGNQSRYSLRILANKMLIYESQQSMSIPHGNDVVRHIDKWARGESWVLAHQIAQCAQTVLVQNAYSYSKCKAKADIRRGQMFEIEKAASARPDAPHT